MDRFCAVGFDWQNALAIAQCALDRPGKTLLFRDPTHRSFQLHAATIVLFFCAPFACVEIVLADIAGENGNPAIARTQKIRELRINGMPRLF